MHNETSVSNHREVFSFAFPITLSALDGTSGFLHFDIPTEDAENLSTHLTVQLHTNRGLIVKNGLPYKRVPDLLKM
jgi:hypothetical protein